MTDLAVWLLEQIAVDAQHARRAADASATHWVTDRDGDVIAEDSGDIVAEGPHGAGMPDVGPHIAWWEPVRVLAECDAKRRIVTLHTPGDRDRDCPECTDRDYRGSAGMPLVWCDTLKLLALPYATRDGYRKEWRPDGD